VGETQQHHPAGGARQDIKSVDGASNVQVQELIYFCWQNSLNEIISDVYGHLLRIEDGDLPSQLTGDKLDVLIDFLRFQPTLVISFVRICPWNVLPSGLTQQLNLRTFDLLHALILSADRMGVMVVHHLQALLREAISLSLGATKELLETAALVVKDPELLLTVLMECQSALSAVIKHVDPESIAYFLRNMYGIALEHCDEACEELEYAPGFWNLTSRAGTLLVTSRRRIDAPRLSRLAMGDHVRFAASQEPVNTITNGRTCFDALVESASDNEVVFRCFRQPPPFMQDCSWLLKHCGPFITVRATADAMLELLLRRDQCCGVYENLILPQKFVSGRELAELRNLEHETVKLLNASQNLAVETALTSSLTCLWGPPGTGKTTTVVALLQALLDHDKQCRILVAAPTHNAVDNVLRQYIKKVSANDRSSPQPVRVSTEVGLYIY
jgi:hypothetical protein